MICKVCGEDRDASCFERQKNRPNPRTTCKECRYEVRKSSPNYTKELERHREYSRQYRERNPDKVRMSWERNKYGACKEDFSYEECWICGSTLRLCIDHDHTTVEVRGLLCSGCNSALGHFKDNKESMMKAVEYLKDGPHWQLSRKSYP
jgi:hypothetical protein